MKLTVKRNRRCRSSVGLRCILILVFILAGCAYTPLRVEDIVMAEVKVASAMKAGAEKFAPEELKCARQNVVDAQTAMEKRQYQDAHRLIDEAILLAAIAEARARQKSAEERHKQLENEIKQLQKDLVEAEVSLEKAKERLFKQF